MTAAERPRFSIVSATYNVAPYLKEFIDSIEDQGAFLADAEVVMVDDGSTDETSQILAEWAARRPETVRVITQDNAGQGAARNTGIAAARGEWITFPDPDDVLEPGYLKAVARFLDRQPEADMVATARILWNETTGRITDTHPLRSMFSGSPYVDLSLSPECFHGSSPATFFRLDRIREHGLTFDSRVRPNFEDGHFNSRYLLLSPAPKVGFLEKARYLYRKRADASSTLQTAAAHPGRYTAVLRHGYLDLIERSREQYGEVPGWLASFILYELHWYFSLVDAKGPAGRPIEGELTEEFHALAEQILGSIDVERAIRYISPSVRQITRDVLRRAYADQPWHSATVDLSRLDPDQDLVRASYYFTGDLPAETWRSNGEAIVPAHAKVRHWDFYGRTLLKERIVWLPANRTIRVALDGADVDLVFRDWELPPEPVGVMPPGQLRYWLNDSSIFRSRMPLHVRPRTPRSKKGKVAQRLYHRPPARTRYADAWVLMDRVHDANDSAEILFRHLREHHPDINAWFVLEKGTPEWDRFRKEGHGDRLVAYGSVQWRLLLANASHLLSSHADAAIVTPAAIHEFTFPRWRFHFLQHGVIKDDLSSWLDPKRIDTFVVSTPQELASIAGDATSYIFTTKEVAMTGLPRFDRMLEVGRRFPPEKRDLLLVTPTWRNGLLPPIIEGTQRRELDLSLLDSYFVKSWLAYLTDPALAEACAAAGVKLGFLPHPNLQPLLPMMNLPAHVEALSYEGNDVQELFARARAFVTDFSSVAFNAAYLERPVVYFQFDADTVLGGGHVGRAGYFDYHRDGFGPVAETSADAVAATIAALEHGPDPLPDYKARIDATFPQRDGGCCERVVERVRATTTRTSGEPTPTPVAP